MAMSKQIFKLCYVQHGILYFTDNFEKQWGDDWDDAPYQHNAEEPYEYADDWPEYMNEHRGHIRYIGYVPISCDLQEAYYWNPQDISVEEINKGTVPWLTNGWNEKQGLYAGATMEETTEWLKRAGAVFGELTKGGKKHESDT